MRGGARAGAGRPRVSQKKVSLQIYVSPDIRQRARALRGAGVPVSRMVEQVIARAYERKISGEDPEDLEGIG